jgi:hypothetical protein
MWFWRISSVEARKQLVLLRLCCQNTFMETATSPRPAPDATPDTPPAAPVDPAAALAGFITIDAAARRKRLAPRTLAQHAARGHVPGAVKVGGTRGVWLFDAASLARWTPAPRGRPRHTPGPRQAT